MRSFALAGLAPSDFVLPLHAISAPIAFAPAFGNASNTPDTSSMSTNQMFIRRFGYRGGFVGLGLLVLAGCGPSADVMQAQEEQIQQAYKEATTNPPKMNAKAALRRKQRVEMDFGISPESQESDGARKAGR